MPKGNLQHGRWLCALYVFVFIAAGSACTSDDQPRDGSVEEAGLGVGDAADFSWRWDEVSILPNSRLRYSIGVTFENISGDRSGLPRCSAIPGPDRAAPLVWANPPILDPGEEATVQGIVRFKRPILEVDEVAC